MSKDIADSYDFVHKIILIGDSGVGKSCLLSRFVLNEFDKTSKSTIGVEFFTKIVQIGEKKIKAQLWDSAGQEKYYSITNSYFRGAVGAILIYDVTDLQSFKNMDRWITILKDQVTPDVVSMIIANKIDLKAMRAVSTIAGEELADLNDMLFIEASALNANNVEKAFELSIQKVHNRQRRRKKQSTLARPYIRPTMDVPLKLDKLIFEEEDKNKSCC